MKNKFRIMLAVLLAMSLLASASAATVSLAYSGGALNLRNGPGRDYASVGIVHDGDSISIVAYGDVWTKVRTSGGKVGYIKNLYISNGDGNYASGTNYFGDRFAVYTTASVNMRSGASTGTTVIGSIGKGTKLTALGSNGGFYLVETKSGTQGYISKKYLSRSGSSGGASSSGATKTVTASYVNMRSGGGMHFDVVRVLPRGTKVTVLKKGNYWTQVSYKGSKGWIKNIYLK